MLITGRSLSMAGNVPLIWKSTRIPCSRKKSSTGVASEWYTCQDSPFQASVLESVSMQTPSPLGADRHTFGSSFDDRSLTADTTIDASLHSCRP